MPKTNPSDISTAVNTPLSTLVHGLFNYGIDGNIISGGMFVNAAPNVYEESIDQLALIGSKLRMVDGTEFHYCKAGAAGIGIAKMAQAEAVTSDWTEEVQTAFGLLAGVESGTVLITGTAPVANEWAEGWLLCSKGAGIGQRYRIQTNTSHATEPFVTLYDAVITEIAAASEISIIKSNFMDTIVVDKTAGLTAHAIGVPLIDITASYYYWSQTKGPAALIVDTGDSVSVGFPVTHPATAAVDGTCGPCVTLENRYGDVMWVGDADEPCIVNLDLGL